uniref:Retroviral polymerase SH3-like domain-containing protein n=1 Tax=Physcomitrium patens TaxID=3218 RepID=A0A7I4D720_PHYPA
MWIYFLKQKSQVFAKFCEFKSMIEKQTGRPIEILRTNRGGGFLSTAFSKYCKAQRIHRQLIQDHIPHRNGVVERPKTLLYLLNRTPTRENMFSLSSEEFFSASKFELPQNLWAHLRNKLDSRSIANSLVGYDDQSKAYRIYLPLTTKIIVSKDKPYSKIYNVQNQQQIKFPATVCPLKVIIPGIMALQANPAFLQPGSRKLANHSMSPSRYRRSQIQDWVDVEETFAPVVAWETICTLLAIASQNGYTIVHMDIITTFLHGPCKEEHEEIDNFLKEIGFKPGMGNLNLYSRVEDQIIILITLYVDDLLMVGNSTSAIKILKAKRVFKLGRSPITWYLKKQPIVILSSSKAEYRALAKAAKTASWLRTLLEDLHFSIKVQSGELILEYIPTVEQPTDIFTKPLDPESTNSSQGAATPKLRRLPYSRRVHTIGNVGNVRVSPAFVQLLRCFYYLSIDVYYIAWGSLQCPALLKAPFRQKCGESGMLSRRGIVVTSIRPLRTYK